MRVHEQATFSLVKAFVTCWLRLSRGLSHQQQRVTDTVACLFDALCCVLVVLCLVVGVGFNSVCMWRTVLVACFGLNFAVNVPDWLRLLYACIAPCRLLCTIWPSLLFCACLLRTAVHRITEGLSALRTGRSKGTACVLGPHSEGSLTPAGTKPPVEESLLCFCDIQRFANMQCLPAPQKPSNLRQPLRVEILSILYNGFSHGHYVCFRMESASSFCALYVSTNLKPSLQFRPLQDS